MKVRAVALLTLAGLAVVGAWLWCSGGDEPQATGKRPATTVPVANGSPVTAAGELDAPARTDAAPIEAPGPTPTNSASHVLRGTFVVVDDQGVEHRAEQGTLRLSTLRGLVRGPVTIRAFDVDVRDGEWQLEVPALPERLTVAEARLGGRLASCPDQIEIDGDPQAIELRGAWLATMRLRVLGEDSGADLAGVRVVAGREAAGLRFAYPGNAADLEVLVANARSPLQFEPTESAASQKVWVRAEGYAWQLVELATKDTTERVVRLTPGGSVDVSIVGGSLPIGTWLRVRGNRSTAPAAEFTFRRGAITRIDGLAVGTWQLQVEKGLWYQNPVSLGSVQTQITAGTIGNVTIVLRDDLAAPEPVPVAGTLRLPTAWGDRIALGIEPRGDTRAWHPLALRIELANMQPLGNGAYRWDAGRLPIGTYRASVVGAAFQNTFSLPVGGDTNIDITVPEPCRVRVRCVDTESGRQLPPGRWSLSWYATATETGISLEQSAASELPDGTFRLLAPPGEIALLAHPPDYQWGRQVVQVVPGDNEVVMQIRQACGIEITLKDDQTGVTLPFLAAVALTMQNGDSAISYSTSSRIATREPGEFSLSLGDVPGYESTPAQKVTVMPSTWTKIEIRLRKSQ